MTKLSYRQEFLDASWSPYFYISRLVNGKYKAKSGALSIMNRTERRLSAVSSFLTHAGRLELINSVLSSLPTYAMCTLQAPIGVLEYIDRDRRHCLWRGSERNAKMKPLVAWKKCCKPKKKGGLGIINLRSQNYALLMKHLDKFYNQLG